jgi:hypothetical protein
MVTYNLHLQATIGNLAGQVGQAQAVAAATSAAAVIDQALPQAARNADRLDRLVAPSKCGNKKKDANHVRQWLPVIWIYIRLASGPIWRVSLDPCGLVCTRRIKRLMQR